MRQDQRLGVSVPFPTHVDKMNTDAIDLRLKMRKLIERRLVLAPVVVLRRNTLPAHAGTYE